MSVAPPSSSSARSSGATPSPGRYAAGTGSAVPPDSGAVGSASDPHTRQSGSARTVSVSQVCASPSWTSRRPISGSPSPTMSLIASTASTEPIAPTVAPRTPPTAHDGT